MNIPEKRISDIQEKEVVSLFDKDLLLTKLENRIIMVSKKDITLMTATIKRHNYRVEPSTVEAIHEVISRMERTGLSFAQLILIEIVQRDLVPRELAEA